MKRIQIFLSMLAVSLLALACPGKDETALDNEPAELQSAPAAQINAENAEAQADAILKDIDNL